MCRRGGVKYITCPHCSGAVPLGVPKTVKNCAACGSEFSGLNGTKYCSRKCSRRERQKRERKTESYRARMKRRYERKKKDPKFVEKYRLMSRLYWAKSKTENPIYAVKNYLRKRIRKILKKHGTTISILVGCSGQELKAHIEAQFENGMDWSNYGTVWVIDHIHPLASFDLTDKKQVLIACHFSNLRPLFREENQEKGAKITVPQMNLRM